MKNIKSSVALCSPTEADALRLSLLATQVFLDTYAFDGITDELAIKVAHDFSVDAFLRILATPETFVTMAIHQKALVGFAQTTVGTPQALVPKGAPAELDRLYVQEPFTRHGVGSALLANHEAQAAERGAAVLWLSTWVENHRARNFYPRRNFQDYGATFFSMGSYVVENRVFAKGLQVAA